MTCFLIVGAAATSILGRDSVPAARLEMAPPVVTSPAANRESKRDRLALATAALASFGPPPTASLSEPPRQPLAFAAPAASEAPRARPPVAWPAAPATPP